MAMMSTLWIRLKSDLLSLFKRSLKSHGSVHVSDLSQSLAFYRRLGFSKVTASRGQEVTLLRNHRGDELNLVLGASRLNVSDRHLKPHVSFQVDSLDSLLSLLRSSFGAAFGSSLEGGGTDFQVIEHAMSRRLALIDPDQNVVEFFETLGRDVQSRQEVYHIVTRPELIAGLSEHYYLPPEEQNRFVRAKARSAILAIACQRVAEEVDDVPLIVELVQDELSIESQLFDDADYDAPLADTHSTYPRVNSPIPRRALKAVGVCQTGEGDFSWPARFASVDAVAADLV